MQMSRGRSILLKDDPSRALSSSQRPANMSTDAVRRVYDGFRYPHNDIVDISPDVDAPQHDGAPGYPSGEFPACPPKSHDAPMSSPAQRPEGSLPFPYRR